MVGLVEDPTGLAPLTAPLERAGQVHNGVRERRDIPFSHQVAAGLGIDR
jgi:hypothetical protein